ncbi:rhodanese-like domain-containing protein [Brevibacillus parabrevis]|nr:rhodanese-like domain-containing protein [Brevibacillus parabrevis]MDR4998296.1 rhodanese-like domain-containing protein [Brevibacillus parabrevis]
MNVSVVLQIPAAPPAQAHRHFLAKLSLETDVSDVWNDLQNGVANYIIVDARSEKAYQECHVPGAISLPHALISGETTAFLDRSKLLVVYCWSPACNGAAKACAKLAELGFSVKEMLGGMEYWQREGNRIEGSILPKKIPPRPLFSE